MQLVGLDASDNAVTAIRPFMEDVPIEYVLTTQLMPSGQKIATADIVKGAAVYKYAQATGYASEGIVYGAHVHSLVCAMFIGTTTQVSTKAAAAWGNADMIGRQTQ